MAIALGSTAQSQINGTSLTYSQTCNGNNRILFTGVGAEQGTGDTITSVTYATVPMTRIDMQVNINTTLNYRVYLYYLIAPATGANNIVISASGTINIHGLSSSFTGVLQTGQPDSYGKASLNTANLDVTTTVVLPNSWIFSIGHGYGIVPGAGTGLTSRQSNSNTRIGDSNGVVLTGSNTVRWTGVGAQDIAGIAASFSPVPEALGGASFLMNFV